MNCWDINENVIIQLVTEIVRFTLPILCSLNEMCVLLFTDFDGICH